MRRNIDVVLDAPVVVAASSTTPGTVVSKPFTLQGTGRDLLIAVRVTGVTVTNAISVNLWTGVCRTSAGVVTWRATADKSVAVAANGVVEIKLVSTDATDLTKMPLGVHAKVTVITGVGDTATVQEVRVVETDRPT